MKKNSKQVPTPRNAEEQAEQFPGYAPYPPSEDIYNQFKEEQDLDPENPNKAKVTEIVRGINEKDFTDDVSGSDLDIPGAELDDSQEALGSEDEENNYYSLGGDNHETQEENTGKD